MLQNNPLLAQLKQQLHSQTPRAEGVVKAHDKGYGFLETDNKKSYFIPASQMKNVLDGDKVSGILIENGEKTSFEPDTLIEPALNTFLAQVTFSNKALEIIPESVSNRPIKCKVSNDIEQKLQEHDWVKAKLVSHPLRDKSGFFAEITQFVAEDKDINALWLIALAKYNLEASAPNEVIWNEPENADQSRIDLTDVDFFTIDGAETQDMDDALSITQDEQGNYILQVAIADPSAYINEESEIDTIACSRSFSTYLPGFTISMLPESLANKLCSLKANEKRPALVCKIVINPQGDICYDATQFNLAWVESKAKLSYEGVSNFIDHGEDLSIEIPNIQSQLKLLLQLAEIRNNWRYENALLFRDNPDYYFIFDNNRQLIDIKKQTKLTAHKMVEEAMVVANQAFTDILQKQLPQGIFNIHAGFESKYLDVVIKILSENNIEDFDKDRLSSFEGYKALRQLTEKNQLLEYRLRRYQSPADFAFEANPHFGLGFHAYATWTSPIRKYGDLLNHRLLKSMISGTSPTVLDSKILSIMNERRRATRLAEREVSNKLYCQYLQDKVGQNFAAEIIDLNRGGAKVRLTDIGAVAFLPASLIHNQRNELTISPENGYIKIKDELAYQLLDTVNVTINEVKKETGSIIVGIARE